MKNAIVIVPKAKFMERAKSRDQSKYKNLQLIRPKALLHYDPSMISSFKITADLKEKEL